jgi:hypothetical protein
MSFVMQESLLDFGAEVAFDPLQPERVPPRPTGPRISVQFRPRNVR